MVNTGLVWFGKTVGWLLRLVGRHGAALPGLMIERIKPSFLPQMLERLPEGVIIISGTNGKTTTTKMVAELFAAEGKRALTNKTGSNFVRGIISTIVQAATPTGRLPYDVAVIELDEAYAAKFVQHVSPKGVVVLNVMRDQLDRFGEIDTTARLLQKVVDKAASFVVLNADDNRTGSMQPPAGVRVFYFGIDKKLAEQFPNDEEMYGISKVEQTQKTPEKQVVLAKVVEEKATYNIDGKAHEVELLIDGQHNALNGAAALTTLIAAGSKQPRSTLIAALASVKPAFGRGELVAYKERSVILQLVKNPAGFRQSLHILDIHSPALTVIAINDQYADGRDVSWLWDVSFSQLSKFDPVWTAGIRGYDMALRLKYDEIESQVLGRLEQVPATIEAASEPGDTVIIFATYTAMLKLRKLLGKKTAMADI